MQKLTDQVAQISYLSEIKNKVLDTARMLLDDNMYTKEHAAQDLMETAWLLIELEEGHFHKYKELIQKITGKPFMTP